MNAAAVVGVGLTVAIGVLVCVCGTAQAGEYAVHTCTDPDAGYDGGFRPLRPTVDDPRHVSGWDLSRIGIPAFEVFDRCAAGASVWLDVPPHSPIPGGQSVGLRWTAPDGTSLVHVRSFWEASSDFSANNATGTAQISATTDQQNLFARNSPASFAFGYLGYPVFDATVAAARWFEIRVTCIDQCPGLAGNEADIQVLTAVFDLKDVAPPIGGLLGPATDAQTWSGVMHFALNAADVGGGVFRAAVQVDGVDALTLPLGDAAGVCRDIGPSPDVNEFAAAQPCPLRIDNGSLDVDTSKLPQGQHSVRVLLEDAAGNRTAIFGPVVRTIAANGAVGPGSDPVLRGAANGSGASDQAELSAHWGKRGSRTRLVSPFGRAHVVRGRLRARDGAAIGGAAIDVVSRTTAVGARELVKRNVPRTRADGSWFLVLPRSVSSRDVTFRYRSHLNDTVASASASVRLRVRAGLRLAIHPRVARRGQRIRFAGRLLGGPLPRGGKQIVLMARASRGGWVRFNVVRSGKSGRFTATYRFQQPGAARYRFRALSLAEAAYPYLAGGSNVVTVRKR
jgi:hypothetical protein